MALVKALLVFAVMLLCAAAVLSWHAGARIAPPLSNAPAGESDLSLLGEAQPFLPVDARPLDAGTREKLEDRLAKLEADPRNPDLLDSVIQVLVGEDHYWRALPYFARYEESGGTRTDRFYFDYSQGLVRTGQFERADRLLKEFEAKYPGFVMAKDAREDYFLYKCLYACRILQDPVLAAAALIGMHSNFLIFSYPSSTDDAGEELASLLHRQVQARSNGPALLLSTEVWPFLLPEQAQRVVTAFEQSGVAVSDAMRRACDLHNEGYPAHPAALRLRSRHCFSKLKDYKTAAALADRSVREARACGDSRQLLYSLVFQFGLGEISGDLPTACASASEALKLAHVNGEPGTICHVTHRVGRMYEKLGDLKQAVVCYSQSLAIAEKYREHLLINRAKDALASVTCQLGDAVAAEPFLRERFERAGALQSEGSGDHRDLGLCLFQQKRFAEAKILLHKGATCRFFSVQADCHLALGRIALAESQPEVAERQFQMVARLEGTIGSLELRWAWQSGMAKAARLRKDGSGAALWIERSLEAIELQRASLRDYHLRSTLLDNKNEVFDMAICMALEDRDSPRAFAIAERSRARTFLDALAAKNGSIQKTEISDLRSLQAICQEFSTLVFFETSRGLVAWIVRKDSLDLVEIPCPPEELKEVVGLIYGHFAQMGQVTTARAWEAPCRRVYEEVWSPLASKIKSGERLCIIPHRLLHYVPFHALYDGRRFVVEEHEIFYAPSGSALIALWKNRTAPAPGVLVMDAIASRNPNSPFHITEGPAIAAMVPGTKAFLYEAATLEVFEREAGPAGLIHIGSHGRFDPSIPTRSGLILSTRDGSESLLSAGEVYELRLRGAPLVVMSACVSSVGALAGGDEVTGLARAFHVAGAQNVVGSLWPVKHAATTNLMKFFYEELLKRPTSPVTALCVAQRRYLKTDIDPAHWAAFELNGHGMCGPQFGPGSKP